MFVTKDARKILLNEREKQYNNEYIRLMLEEARRNAFNNDNFARRADSLWSYKIIFCINVSIRQELPYASVITGKIQGIQNTYLSKVKPEV